MSLLTVNSEDTICAVATAPGRGGIAIIRVSGGEAVGCTQKIFPALPETPDSHRVYYGYIQKKKLDLDEVLVSFFESQRSFTGEDTCEINCHGNPTVTSEILDLLVENGCRVAEPGEFTFRAFMNQRIDLLQAEGVLDVIESETRLASKLALRQLKGGLSEAIGNIESQLTRVLAHLEANIDFAAEDIVIESNDSLISQLNETKSQIASLIQSYTEGRAIHDGVNLAIVGRPNVGKSSLLNQLAGEEKAIVTDIAGTTRDIVEASFLHKGLRFNVFDTAGLRKSDDRVEQLGISKTKEAAIEADLILFVVDATHPELPDDSILKEIDSSERNFLLLNKIDLLSDELELPGAIREILPTSAHFKVSAQEGTGIEALKEAMVSEFLMSSEQNQTALLTNSRHLNALKQALISVEKSMQLMKEQESPDLIAFEMMEGLKQTQQLLGKKFDDEVLDRVFKEFCLGK